MKFEDNLPFASNDQWWKGGVIYQVYPRSYADTNNDGIGDLRGITSKLPYIVSLGVDAIWLSPFFKSPMKDFGYDVSDYCAIDPMFGTIEDFKELVEQAHKNGLKVMIDQVISHTSDQHEWFIQSRSSKTNPKADWYIWADAKEDGTAPNNWLSIFGGSAWQWDTAREQYYMHNFLASQPDLNFHNQQVQDALLKSVQFWLDLGVDGFRLDTVNFYFHSQSLQDNPARGKPANDNPAVSSVNPYAYQWHKFDKSQPENLLFLQRLRRLLDAYPNTTMVGEIGDDHNLERVAEYTEGSQRLHMAYSFDLLGKAHSPVDLKNIFNAFAQVGQDSWVSWSTGNHDVERMVTRWDAQGNQAKQQVAIAILLSAKGTPCLYQGEELGLPEANIAYEDLQDPYGITMWPKFKGRDGCRSPMPWQTEVAHAGFGTGAQNKTWLPVDQHHLALAVDSQDKKEDSLLNFYRRILHWRKAQEALVKGEQQVLSSNDQTLALLRTSATQELLCVFNFSDSATTYQLPQNFANAQIVLQVGTEECLLQHGVANFPAWSGIFLTN